MNVRPDSELDALRALLWLAMSQTQTPAFVQRRPLAFTGLFVDPQNSTGHASNANPGTALAPILNTAEVNRRFFFGQLTGNTTVTYLSEETGTVGLDLSTTDLETFNLTVNMPLIVTHTGGTLNVGTTAINPLAAAGGQRQTAHTTDIATFAPFAFSGLGGASPNPQRLVDTVTGGTAWIVSGAATASMSRPVDEAVSIADALTIGDAYKIQRGGLLPLANAPAPVSDGGRLTFNNAIFTASSVGPAQITGFSTSPIVCNHCSWLGPVLFGGAFNDCYFAAGMQGNWSATIVAGVLLPNTNNDQQTGALNFSGDTYVTGPSTLHLGATFYQGSSISPGFGLAATSSGIQVQDCGPPGIRVEQGATAFVQGLIWGNGNADVGILIVAGADLVVGVVPSVTGVAGDFAFLSINLERNTARAWNEGTDSYNAAIACTWANFNAGFPGGFANNAHDVTGNSSIVLVV